MDGVVVVSSHLDWLLGVDLDVRRRFIDGSRWGFDVESGLQLIGPHRYRMEHVGKGTLRALIVDQEVFPRISSKKRDYLREWLQEARVGNPEFESDLIADNTRRRLDGFQEFERYTDNILGVLLGRRVREFTQDQTSFAQLLSKPEWYRVVDEHINGYLRIGYGVRRMKAHLEDLGFHEPAPTTD